MKKLRFCSLVMILAILASCFSGCIQLRVNTNESASPSQQPTQGLSPTQAPTQEPTQKPSDSPVLPDIETMASFLFDLNGDGASETISVGLGTEGDTGTELIISVSDNGSFNQAVVDSGYFESAFMAATPGGAPCLLVCCDYEDDYSSTFACSFSGLKPIVHDRVPGRIKDIKGSEVMINSWVDALGTWSCNRSYRVSDSFVFEPLTDFQVDLNG